MIDPIFHSPEPISLPEGIPAAQFEAELRQVQHVVASAADEAGLLLAARRIQELVHRLVDQTQAARAMTLFISLLNDLLTRRVIEVVSAEAAIDGVRWCWISLGSEGRQEQTLSSDQDNGIIFAGDMEASALRSKMLPLAQRINTMLDACGFPLCTGEVMASNPEWCLSLPEWKERFRNWIIEGDPQALLNASIFFDLRPLYGATELSGELTEWLAREAAANPRFQFQMAANAMKRNVPLGLFNRFVVDKHGKYPGTIDLKVGVSALFVDAARIYGLACGSHASNTAERFQQAVNARRLHPKDAERWIRAFYFVQMLRLKIQQRSYRLGQEMHNHLAPRELDRSDRWFLRDALLQARSLHRRLQLDYPGSHGMF
ncbi:DUF294 nucleotidyltransferase-like domain-containing protein [Noviherbaspirillum autotrophicum]|uniref:DUF294 nucleotidyltransferase-like domain-containing protein n=1 Tax=Noviherbaspirillum autotrophicum TaxID=709839 RepID=UPI00069497D1|nr:DUF294 nucleotidyltransferase-like domain-containing protein [Noviherbaspirillum autotrophicum]